MAMFGCLFGKRYGCYITLWLQYFSWPKPAAAAAAAAAKAIGRTEPVSGLKLQTVQNFGQKIAM